MLYKVCCFNAFKSSWTFLLSDILNVFSCFFLFIEYCITEKSVYHCWRYWLVHGNDSWKTLPRRSFDWLHIHLFDRRCFCKNEIGWQILLRSTKSGRLFHWRCYIILHCLSAVKPRYQSYVNVEDFLSARSLTWSLFIPFE